jgi:pilus assembly protein CpaE
MSGKIRILIVDDIAESRDNVAKLLRFEPDVEIVGMADNGEQAIELCERLEPHIVLMDVNMPGMDGITATTRITSRFPNTAVVMMSVQNEPEYLRRSMMAGARQFLAKPFSLDELVDTVRHVHLLNQQTRKVVHSGPEMHHSVVGPARNRKAKIISTFSLKGGVGRTTLAANLAVAIRNRYPDREVAVVDGNLLHGDRCSGSSEQPTRPAPPIVGKRPTALPTRRRALPTVRCWSRAPPLSSGSCAAGSPANSASCRRPASACRRTRRN